MSDTLEAPRRSGEDAQLVPVHPRPGLRAQGARFALVIVLVGMYVVFAALRPEQFLNLDNLRIIASSQAVPLLLAVAVTFPLRAGDFDLSIGSCMVLAASVVAVLTTGGTPVPLALLAALAAGLVVGLVNAGLVVGVGLAPFIVTLGTLIAVEGVALTITGAQFIAGLPQDFRAIFTTRVLGLPLSVWSGFAVAAVAWTVQTTRPFGRHLLFTGWDRSAAQRTGVKVRRVRVVAFVTSSVLAAFAGIVFAASLGAVDPVAGISFVLTPYAAAFLGTTTIAIGRFNVIGTLVGLFFLAIGVSGLQLLGASYWIASIFDGVALIGAITFARIVHGSAMEV